MTTNKVIASFGFGSHSNLLDLSILTFNKYARTHNYDLFVPNNSFFSATTKTRHYSWWKLELISKLLATYDIVLWIDADVIIRDFNQDILDDFNQTDHMGLVVHETPDGSVPNCGVWILNKKSLSWFDQLWEYDDFKSSKYWWEQASLLHTLGINPDVRPIQLPKKSSIPWTKLDYRWNPHINDHRAIPEDYRFFHSTMIDNKIEITKKILLEIISQC
ncbi:MAG: hypothetical protein EBZ62_00335 [Sphingobacteriia bacterium]|nr:hypothetical protein [Sphingobacteriia bacterium]